LPYAPIFFPASQFSFVCPDNSMMKGWWESSHIIFVSALPRSSPLFYVHLKLILSERLQLTMNSINVMMIPGISTLPKELRTCREGVYSSDGGKTRSEVLQFVCGCRKSERERERATGQPHPWRPLFWVDVRPPLCQKSKILKSVAIYFLHGALVVNIMTYLGGFSLRQLSCAFSVFVLFSKIDSFSPPMYFIPIYLCLLLRPNRQALCHYTK
jgi:hypothetical protein